MENTKNMKIYYNEEWDQLAEHDGLALWFCDWSATVIPDPELWGWVEIGGSDDRKNRGTESVGASKV